MLKKKICFIHYGIGWRDGVNTVIKNLSFELVKNPFLDIYFIGGEVKKFLKKAHYKKLDFLIPFKNNKKISRKEIDKKARVYAQKIALLTKEMDYVIIENPFLGDYHLKAMRSFYFYAKEYKPKKTKIFFRIHDFYSDYPSYRVKINELFSSSEIREMIKAPGTDGFLIVNLNLKEKLAKAGAHPDKMFYLPNGINEEIFKVKTNKADKKKIYKEIGLPLSAKIILYPVRVVLRKNIEEAVIYLYLLRKALSLNYVLVVTGKIDRNDPLSFEYYKKIVLFAKEAKTPIIFLKGRVPTKIEKGLKRKKDFTFSLGQLYRISEAVIMTSLQEGFGYPYLECWLGKKFLLGRSLENIIKNFEKQGLDFSWLYKEFYILDKKDKVLDLNFKKRMERIERIKMFLKNKDFYKNLLEMNKSSFFKQIEILNNRDKREKIIKKNFEKTKEIYSISSIAEKFLEIVNYGKD